MTRKLIMLFMKIKSLNQLKRLASNGGIEVSILLNYGVKSTKFVDYNPATNKWRIENYIDGSAVTKLSDTNIQEAIQKGTLYAE